jgi:hypothetical protein
MASLGLVLSLKAPTVILAILSLPLIGYATKRVPFGRAGVVGLIVAAIGVATLASGPMGSPWEAILLLAILETGTVIGASKALRMTPDLHESAGERPWMNIVVASQPVSQRGEGSFLGRPA